MGKSYVRFMNRRPKLIRVVTVNRSLNKLLEGQLKFMSNYFDVIGVSGPDDTSNIQREREGVRIVDLSMTRSISPFKDIISIWKMFCLFRKEKPDIVHSHTPKAGLVSMIAAKLSGVPIRLHTVAGLPLETSRGLRRRVLLAIEKLVYSLSTVTYPNSFGIKRFIINNGLASKDKIKVIGHGSSNGINLDLFKKSTKLEKAAILLRKDLAIAPHERVFIFAGRLVIDKGIEPLIEAWKGLVSTHKNIKLVFIGSFEKKSSLLSNKTLKYIDSSDSVIYAGYKKDVIPYFCMADYFVFPSFREGLPNVLLQAGALELPIIATNINGNTDIVENNMNGLLVPPNDISALRWAMEQFLNNRSLVKMIQIESRKRIVGKYCRTVIQNELLEEYRNLLTRTK